MEGNLNPHSFLKCSHKPNNDTVFNFRPSFNFNYVKKFETIFKKIVIIIPIIEGFSLFLVILEIEEHIKCSKNSALCFAVYCFSTISVDIPAATESLGTCAFNSLIC